MKFINIYKTLDKIAYIQKKDKADISKSAVVIMCADNGIADSSIAEIAVKTAGGESEYSRMAKAADADVFTLNAGIRDKAMSEWLIDRKTADGTENIMYKPAMSDESMAFAVRSGIEMVKSLKIGDYKIIGASSINSGGNIPMEAVLYALTGYNAVSDCAKEIVSKYSFKSVNRILSTVGSFEIAAMSGLFLGGVLCDMPVMIDDDISAVAAFMAYAIEPKVKNIAVAGCCQSEISRQIFETMNIESITDIQTERTVEGVSVALAVMKIALAAFKF